MSHNKTLYQLLRNHLASELGQTWLDQQLEKLNEDFLPRNFYLSFSACPRYVDRVAIRLTDEEKEELSRHYPNFSATEWTLDQLARILLVTALPPERNQAILNDLFATADYHELIALYKGLYWLDNAEDFVARAREGLRTNMTNVFDAIALDNPFPHRYLTEEAWNQMVLKAMFMERPMYRIYQIEDRKNERLANIFLDYAEERRSAGRKVSPELWRFVAGFVDQRAFNHLKSTIVNGDGLERAAGLRALSASSFPPAQTWLEGEEIEGVHELPTWDEIGQRWE